MREGRSERGRKGDNKEEIRDGDNICICTCICILN